MNHTFSENLFFTSPKGQQLYNDYAKDLPIIDYHCHLLPEEISSNSEFQDLGEMWLAHDHYKWRAMRTFGIEEKYITGSASYYEKYLAFASILPELIGNPLYIWCALELKRFFEIEEPLSRTNADEIYNMTKLLIQEKHITPRWCMERSRVETVCTTDDPIDLLNYHLEMNKYPAIKTRILPAFRTDKSFYCEKSAFIKYIEDLSSASQIQITRFSDLLAALENRLVFFKNAGSMISDIGIEDMVWEDYTSERIDAIFRKALHGSSLNQFEINQYRSAFIVEMAKLYHKHAFVMQLHIGTYQGANKYMEHQVGIATGFDCTDDSTRIKSVGTILSQLTGAGSLPKTILYPLNPAWIEPFAILAAAFCGEGEKAKVQLGAPWWFNDQPYGIARQFEAVANLYPVSLSVGMLTDSRSFLSYPRHEVYRRILCNYLGSLVERGEYFSGEEALQTIIENICYNNAKEFFDI
jgi:glucuronate isomerase